MSQPINFKLGETGLALLREQRGTPNDGLHLITRFERHPGWQGYARDSDGTGMALYQPTDDQMGALFERMVETHGWGV